MNAALISPADATSLPAGRSERRLIVDDDADVRQLLTPFLSDLGYKVSEATGGEDALSILADVKPDIMIIDFAMRGLNDAETALAARQRYPGIPILFVSGFADTEALRSAVGTAPLVHKPFHLAERSRSRAFNPGCIVRAGAMTVGIVMSFDEKARRSRFFERVNSPKSCGQRGRARCSLKP